MPIRKKRVITKLRLQEISAVDRPAQQHAVATIMKRDELNQDAETMTKPLDQLESLAAAYAKEKNVDMATAHTILLNSEIGKGLYEAHKLQKIGFAREVNNQNDIAKGAGLTYEEALEAFAFEKKQTRSALDFAYSTEGSAAYGELKKGEFSLRYPQAVNRWKDLVKSHLARDPWATEKSLTKTYSSEYAAARLAGMPRVDGAWY